MQKKVSSLDKCLDKCLEKLAEDIRQKILNNNAFWRKSWDDTALSPHNPVTGNFYSGFNFFLTTIEKHLQDYPTSEWLTFNNIKELGGKIKKGSSGLHLLKYGVVKPTEEKLQEAIREEEERTQKKLTDKEKDFIEYSLSKAYLTTFCVFNIAQTENIDFEKIKELQSKKGIVSLRDLQEKELCFKNNAFVEGIMQNSNIQFKTHPTRAFYVPSEDTISLPPKGSFHREEDYYATALHELGHATGHKDRLDRNFGYVGEVEESKKLYAIEELRAELFSYLQGQKLGLAFNDEEHLAYLKSWSNPLELSKELMLEVLKDSMKMCDFVEKKWYPSQEQVQEIEKNIQRTQEQPHKKKQKDYGMEM